MTLLIGVRGTYMYSSPLAVTWVTGADLGFSVVLAGAALGVSWVAWTVYGAGLIEAATTSLAIILPFGPDPWI